MILQSSWNAEKILSRHHAHDLAILNEAAQKHHHHKTPTQIFDTYIRDHLKDAIFVGHVNTDLDSVAGAIGAAALFGGIAAVSEKNLNGEILFALSEAGIPAPALIDEVPGAVRGSVGERKICLVDHSEVKQMTPLLRNDPDWMGRICGVIDHHALASTFRRAGFLLPGFSEMFRGGS